MHALERLELVGAKNENVYVPAYVVKKNSVVQRITQTSLTALKKTLIHKSCSSIRLQSESVSAFYYLLP